MYIYVIVSYIFLSQVLRITHNYIYVYYHQTLDAVLPMQIKVVTYLPVH